MVNIKYDTNIFRANYNFENAMFNLPVKTPPTDATTRVTNRANN